MAARSAGACQLVASLVDVAASASPCHLAAQVGGARTKRVIDTGDAVLDAVTLDVFDRSIPHTSLLWLDWPVTEFDENVWRRIATQPQQSRHRGGSNVTVARGGAALAGSWPLLRGRGSWSA